VSRLQPKLQITQITQAATTAAAAAAAAPDSSLWAAARFRAPPTRSPHGRTDCAAGHAHHQPSGAAICRPSASSELRPRARKAGRHGGKRGAKRGARAGRARPPLCGRLRRALEREEPPANPSARPHLSVRPASPCLPVGPSKAASTATWAARAGRRKWATSGRGAGGKRR